MSKIIYNKNITGKDIDDVWSQWYAIIAPESKDSNLETTESRDGAVVGEVINATTVIDDPTRCILKSKIRKLPMRYMIGELLWYISGDNSLKPMQLYTHAWDRMSDNGKTVNSNYGDRIQNATDEYSGLTFNQLRMVEEMLLKDPSSRQAVIHIKQARDLMSHPTKDVNCTVCLQFFLRDEKLWMTVYMRSNDLWMGFPNDVFQFTCLQVFLAMRLGVGLGSYIHIAGSLHLYDRDYQQSLINIKERSSDGDTKTANKAIQ